MRINLISNQIRKDFNLDQFFCSFINIIRSMKDRTVIFSCVFNLTCSLSLLDMRGLTYTLHNNQ